MSDAERVFGQGFPPAPRRPLPWDEAPPPPPGTLGEILSGLGVLRQEDRLAQDIGRIEQALDRLGRVFSSGLAPRLPKV